MHPNCQCLANGLTPPAVGPTLSDVCNVNPVLTFLSILQAFIVAQCDILDPCRQPVDTGIPDAVYDFIVIGAGAAGCAVAARLSENPAHRVLLIEAGGAEPTALQVPALAIPFHRSTIDWGYRNEFNPHAFLGKVGQQDEWPRGKMLGGTTALNGMVYMRGNPADYDEWRRLGNEGWSYADVLPYFRRAENHRDMPAVEADFHGNGGPVAVSIGEPQTQLIWDLLEAGAAIGLAATDLNGANCSGIMLSNYCIRDGVRQSAARSYLRPHWRRPNLHVMLETMVTQVLLESGSNRAYAVRAARAETPAEEMVIGAEKEIIICAGTEQSPKLLQLSGIGPADELRRWNIEQRVNLPGVGRNLQNHVAVYMTMESAVFPNVQLDWATATEYLLRRGGPLATLGHAVDLKFASKFSPYPEVPDMQIQISDDFIAPWRICTATADGGGMKTGEGLIVWAAPIVLKPRSVGRIELRSADPWALPRIFGEELSAAADEEMLLEGVRKFFELMDTPVFERYNLTVKRDRAGRKAGPCGRYGTRSERFWRCIIRHDTAQYFHAVGTCRMGPEAAGGAVVDDQLRVHGVRGLRVADASVMPKIVAANPAATAVMIGEKAADLVAAFWAEY